METESDSIRIDDSGIVLLSAIRNMVLRRVMIAALLVGAIALASSIYIQIVVVGRPLVAVYYGFFYAIALCAYFFKRLSYDVRARLFLTVLFVFSLQQLWTFGISSGATIILFAFIILSGGFLGPRAGVSALSLSIVIMVLAGIAYLTGTIPVICAQQEASLDPTDWVSMTLMLALLSSAVLAMLNLLLNRLSQSVEDSTRLVEKLRTEVTERKRAEDRITRAKEEWERTFDTVPDLIAILDTDYRIRRVNKAMANRLGLTAKACVGLTCHHAIHSMDHPPDDCPCALLLRDGIEHTAEIHEASLGGQFLVSASPLRSADGTLTGCVHVSRDISERIRLEEQIRQSQKMEAVGQLAGGIAHDFNNLLQAILGYTDMAMEDLPADSSARTSLVEAYKASERAAALVQQLLAFSRRETIQSTTLDLIELIGDLVKMLRRVIGKHIELTITHAPSLDNVHADPSQLEQILLNLCINARDAMPTGGQITIETRNIELDASFAQHHTWAKPGRYVLMMVSDTGEGMASEVTERIFEPFFTTKEVGKGTGMGLATVFGIVKQHDGLIHVDSTPGQGTAFKTYLPVSKAPNAKNLQAAEQEGPIRGGAETILLAEDEELVRNMAAQVLRKAGYHVLTAHDGEEAIQLFEAKGDDIQLFLLDVVMPRRSGRVVFDRIKAVRPDARVLFSSGYSHDALEASSLPEDGYELIPKPYNPNILLRKVRHLLDRDQ